MRRERKVVTADLADDRSSGPVAAGPCLAGDCGRLVAEKKRIEPGVNTERVTKRLSGVVVETICHIVPRSTLDHDRSRFFRFRPTQNRAGLRRGRDRARRSRS